MTSDASSTGFPWPQTHQLQRWGPGSLQLPELPRDLRVNRHQQGTVTFVCWLSEPLKPEGLLSIMAPVGGPAGATHTVIWLRVPSGQSTRLLIKPLGRAHAASGGGGVNVCEQWSVPVFLILIVSISGCTQRGANLLLSRVQAYVPLHIWIMCQPHNITCYAAWHQVGP